MPNFSILDDTKNALNEIKGSINSSLQQSFNNNQEQAKDLNRVQMFAGIKIDNTAIFPDYADSTKRYKLNKGQPIDRVTLRDTGEFYENLQINAKPDEVVFSSPTSYSAYIFTKYNRESNVLGLTMQNIRVFYEQFTKPILKQNIDDIIAKS
jgi:hypothetical protein